MIYYGDFPTSHTSVCMVFDSFAASTGAPSAVTNFVAGDIQIYKDGGTTQRSSSAGIVVTTSFDTNTGLQMVTIDLSDNTDAGFYAAGHEYSVAVADVTIDGQTVRFWLGAFSIERAGGVLALLKAGTAKVTLADGVAHGGTLGSSTATLALSRVNVTSQTSNTNAITATGNGTGHGIAAASGSGATGNGIDASSAATNGKGIAAAGAGSGEGVKATGGATGRGLYALGGATSGDGAEFAGQTSGHGLTLTGVGTTKHGANANGGSTTSHGISATGGGVGHGILATSGGGATGDGIKAVAASTNGNGFNTVGVGTGAGHLTTGGATGHGMSAVGGATSGDGISSAAATSGAGITATGVGTTKHGINATGGSTSSDGIRATGGGTGHGLNAQSGSGATGNGLNAVSNATAGNGAAVTGVGTGSGLVATSGAGATGDGIQATAASTNGNGMKLTGNGTANGLLSTGGAGAGGDGAEFAAGGGVDIRGNQTGNLVGTVSTLTTYTGNTPQTGDAYARLGAPAGASVSADIAAVKTDTAAIKTKTDSLTFTVAGMADANVVDWKGATAPAMTGDAFARLGAPAGASVSADVAAVKSDSAAIKTKTDSLTFTVAGKADANVLYLNGDATSAANIAKTTRAIGRGTCDGSATTTSVSTSAFSPAGGAADQFKGRIITFDADTTTAALRGQSTDITASSNAAAPVFTVTALTTAPASGDTFSVT